MELPKNCIKLGDTLIEIAPKNEQDCTVITSACINILGFVLAVGTAGIKDSKERVETVMNLAGQVGGAAAKEAIQIIATSDPESLKMKKEDKEEVEDGGNA